MSILTSVDNIESKSYLKDVIYTIQTVVMCVGYYTCHSTSNTNTVKSARVQIYTVAYPTINFSCIINFEYLLL